jgi:hypothetical protein
MTPDDLQKAWALGNSALGIAAIGFFLRQSGRVDTMYQHLFGPRKQGKNGGLSERVGHLQEQLDAAVADAADSPAGRALIVSLERVRSDLANIQTRLAELERGKRR